jgi:hypothetical protein
MENGKMERFCGTFETVRGKGCTEKLIADITHEYNTKWGDRAFGMTRQASGTAGLNDLEGNAIGMQADRTG